MEILGLGGLELPPDGFGMSKKAAAAASHGPAGPVLEAWACSTAALPLVLMRFQGELRKQPTAPKRPWDFVQE
eukprot:8417060-Lingulodinium_polyedra.AAC.1